MSSSGIGELAEFDVQYVFLMTGAAYAASDAAPVDTGITFFIDAGVLQHARNR